MCLRVYVGVFVIVGCSSDIYLQEPSTQSHDDRQVQKVVVVFPFYYLMSAAGARCLHHAVCVCRSGRYGYNSSNTSLSFFCDSERRLFCAYVCVLFWTQRGKIPTHTSSEFLQYPRSTAAVQQQQQQWYTTTGEPLKVHKHRDACALHLPNCDTPGLSSQPHPQGEPCNINPIEFPLRFAALHTQ